MKEPQTLVSATAQEAAATPAPMISPTAAPTPTEAPFDWQRVELRPVDSSCFSRLGYDAGYAVLVAEFKDSGAVYLYFDVPPEEWESFSDAESLGRYFNAYIKDSYAYEKAG